jgi:hypothetical protein
VPAHPLSWRVVLLSWALAVALWPVAWWGVTVAQAIGVLLAGGGWIGAAVPLGAQPWALVNQPGIAYASSRAALWGYWLAPLLGPALLAGLLPWLAPAPSRGWAGELALFHLAFASAALGLAWAAPLGVADGPAAGLFRFWKIAPTHTLAVAALVAVVAVQGSVIRLAARWWAAPGGPRRGRRVRTAFVHGVMPALGWAAIAALAGWPPSGRSLQLLAVVLVGALAAGVAWVPGSPLRRLEQPEARSLLLAAAAAAVVAVLALWAGAPAGGHTRALLWGEPAATNNIRTEMVRVRLTAPRDRAAPPAPSAPGS